MIVLFLGYKTHGRNCIPEVLYVGDDAHKGALAAAERAGEFVRVGRLQDPQPMPVSLPETEASKAARVKRAQEAAATARQDLIAQARARVATLEASSAEVIERARKELAEAEEAERLAALSPEDRAAQERAKKERAEADVALAEAKAANESAIHPSWLPNKLAEPVREEAGEEEFSEAEENPEAAERPAGKKKKGSKSK